MPTQLEVKTPEFDFLHCPKCKQPVVMGYGLAGGGIGPYWACETDECDFFYKKQDSEDVYFPDP
jgi:hypothetical protein